MFSSFKDELLIVSCSSVLHIICVKSRGAAHKECEKHYG